MKMDSLHDLYIQNLKDLYSAEKQILQAMPKMIKKTQNEELRQAIEEHRVQTEEQVRRLEKIGEMCGKRLTGHKCAAMEGLIEEGKEMLEMEGDPNVIDAGIIGSAQRIEHYEIAGYGCARTYARMLGFDDQAKILQQTLDEEGKTDERLNMIAENIVNQRAAQASSA